MSLRKLQGKIECPMVPFEVAHEMNKLLDDDHASVNGFQGDAMKLYVGNLGFTITDIQLGSLFAQYGTVVNARVIRNQATGRGRGFGFIEMSDTEARQAMQLLNGKDVEGRSLTVNEARSTPQDSNDKRV